MSREDDVITSAGYRIGPAEIEDTLIKHPAVALAAVVGVPDPIRTEAVKAWIVLRPGFAASEALAREIQEFVKVKLAAHEYPRHGAVRRKPADDGDRQSVAARTAHARLILFQSLRENCRFLLRGTTPIAPSCRTSKQEANMGFGRGLLLWIIGIPIPLIILLAIFMHH